jgi:hypothetical protein
MIDSVTLEIQWQRLISVMDEIDNATVRTSFRSANRASARPTSV